MSCARTVDGDGGDAARAVRRDREAEPAGRIEAQARALAEQLQRAAAPTAVTTAATTTETSRQMGMAETFIVMIQRGTCRESAGGGMRAGEVTWLRGRGARRMYRAG